VIRAAHRHERGKPTRDDEARGEHLAAQMPEVSNE